MKHIKPFGQIINEDAKYRSEIDKMMSLLEDQVVIAMDGERVDDITISFGKTSLSVPFNADSYSRIKRFLIEEKKEDESLDQ